MSSVYPIELHLSGKPVVVIGGGPVAARKARTLADAGARVRVVSPIFTAELAQRDDIQRVTACYARDLLAPAVLVFACTDDRELNARVAADARQLGIWCNVTDDPALSDFLVPASLAHGPIVVAVGTAGASPALAVRIRDRLASHLEPEWAILAEEIARARTLVRQRVSDPAVRRAIFEALSGDDSLEALAGQDRLAWRRWCERTIEHHLAHRPPPGAD